MKRGTLMSIVFEKIPEVSLKNDLRYFLAFSRLSPRFLQDISPVKGYEKYYQLKKGDFVVDAGAYPGDYAVFAARKVGREGKIICFEPDTKNRKVLEKNLKKEGLNNYIIIPKGLWNRNTTLNLENSDGLHSTLSKKKGSIKIKVARLDDELKELKIPKIDVLKMDIEGAEIEAVQGAKSTLKNNKVHVAIASYHIVNGKTTSFYLENFFKKLGYKSKSDFPNHLTTYAWKNNQI